VLQTSTRLLESTASASKVQENTEVCLTVLDQQTHDVESTCHDPEDLKAMEKTYHQTVAFSCNQLKTEEPKIERGSSQSITK